MVLIAPHNVEEYLLEGLKHLQTSNRSLGTFEIVLLWGGTYFYVVPLYLDGGINRCNISCMPARGVAVMKVALHRASLNVSFDI